MLTQEVIAILENMRHYVASLDATQREALRRSVEMWRRLEDRLLERPPVSIGYEIVTPNFPPVSLEDEAS